MSSPDYNANMWSNDRRVETNLRRDGVAVPVGALVIFEDKIEFAVPPGIPSIGSRLVHTPGLNFDSLGRIAYISSMTRISQSGGGARTYQVGLLVDGVLELIGVSRDGGTQAMQPNTTQTVYSEWAIPDPGPGTHTYELDIVEGSGAGTAVVNNSKLIALV